LNNPNNKLQVRHQSTSSTIPLLLSKELASQDKRIYALEQHLARLVEAMEAITDIDLQDYINPLNNDY